jgi:periplasmic divalent cation tolerance protein
VKSARHISLAFVTVPDVKVARQLTKKILQRKLAACVNIISGVESHYWWQGKLDRSSEFLLIIKTTSTRLASLEKLVVAEHPYDTPEFIAFPLTSGNSNYLSWLQASVKP